MVGAGQDFNLLFSYYNMFHLPILQGSYTNKNELNERKLKYKYLIELNQQYNKLIKDGQRDKNISIINNFPTLYDRNGYSPNTYANNNNSNTYINDPLTPDDSDDNMETRFYHDYIKPQKSYERWFNITKNGNANFTKANNNNNTNNKKRIRKPFQKKQISYKKFNNIVNKTRKRLNLNNTHHSHRQITMINAMINGQIKLNDKNLSDVPASDQHIKILINLLYQNVFQNNWDLSYKIFAILIRLPRIDIKSIWHLGCKILSNCIDKINLLDYLNWLHSFYSTKNNFIQNRNYRNDPVFREGSRTHTPQFSITWIWENLINCYDNIEQLDELIEKINELMLLPPFMDDSQIWFILSMCHFCKANCISQQLNQLNNNGNNDINMEYQNSKLEINLQSSITQVNLQLQKCTDMEIPRDYIQRQLQNMEIRHNEFVVEETSFFQQLDNEDTSFDNNALFLDETYEHERRDSTSSSE